MAQIRQIADRKVNNSTFAGRFGVFFLIVLCGLVWFSQTVIAVGVAWLFGIGFGFILQRTRFCVAASVRDFFLFGSTTLLKALLLIILFSAFGFAAVQYHSLQSGVEIAPGYLRLVGYHTILGGLLFGIGMAVAGSCVVINIMRAGEGFLLSWVTILAIVVGATLAAWDIRWIKPLFYDHSSIVYLPNYLGWPMSIGITSMILAGLVGLIIWYERSMGPLPEIRIKDRSDYGIWKIFRNPWPWWVAVIGLSALNIMFFAFQQEAWGVSSVIAIWGGWLLQATGFEVDTWTFFQTPRFGNILRGGFLNSWETAMNLGVLVGGFGGAWIAQEFRVKKINSVKQFVAAVLGGFLMGYGSRVAMGCTIGALIGGIASFSLHGWIFTIGLVAGVYLGIKLLLRYFV